MNIKHNFQNVIVSLLLLITFQACKVKPSEIKNSKTDFVDIFDGKTLNNWIGDPTYWKVEDGSLVGFVTPETLLKRNSFIIWQGGTPKDFELKITYKISENGNSGVNYRSEIIDSLPFALKGYQADIDGKNNYTGQNYEERKRTTLAYRGEQVVLYPANTANLKEGIKKNAWQFREILGSLGETNTLKSSIKNDDWNEMHLIIKENKMLHYVNGVLMSDITDNDEAYRTFSGHIGVQVHVGPPMKVTYKSIKLKIQ
jgi:hypothetical protein